jgi:hypothetical protein
MVSKIARATSADLNVRHGSILAIAEICSAWSEIRSKDSGSEKWWSETELLDLINVSSMEAFGFCTS